MTVASLNTVRDMTSNQQQKHGNASFTPDPPFVSDQELERSFRFVDAQWDVMEEIVRLSRLANRERAGIRGETDHDI